MKHILLDTMAVSRDTTIDKAITQETCVILLKDIVAHHVITYSTFAIVEFSKSKALNVDSTILSAGTGVLVLTKKLDDVLSCNSNTGHC